MKPIAVILTLQSNDLDHFLKDFIRAINTFGYVNASIIAYIYYVFCCLQRHLTTYLGLMTIVLSEFMSDTQVGIHRIKPFFQGRHAAYSEDQTQSCTKSGVVPSSWPFHKLGLASPELCDVECPCWNKCKPDRECLYKIWKIVFLNITEINSIPLSF